MSSRSPDPSEIVLIVNPESGSADHHDDIRNRARLLDYTVEETAHAGHAVELTEEAIHAGATGVVAVGGDGTLNEVVRGVMAADALADVTVGVVPAGTGNDFASNLGILDIDQGFRVIREGERRWLDVGLANGEPFLNSCIAGLTAEASAETTPEMKSRFGVFAYVLTTLRVLSTFRGLELTAELTHEGETDTVWSGSAAMVLIGNGRRFTLTGGEQAHIEDGLLDVTIIEDATSIDIIQDRTRKRLLGDSSEHMTRILVSTLELTVEGDEPIGFSLDGEMQAFSSVELSVSPHAIRMPVGEAYEPNPPDRG